MPYKLSRPAFYTALLLWLPALSLAQPLPVLNLDTLPGQTVALPFVLASPRQEQLPAEPFRLDWREASDFAGSLPDTVLAAFALAASAKQAQRVLLDPGRWGSAKARVFNKAGTLLYSRQTGGEMPVAERSLGSYRTLLPLQVPAGQTVRVYLQLSGRVSYYRPDKVELRLLPPGSYEQEKDWRLFGQGIFLGIIMVMALYNLLFFLAVRDISYLWYVLSIAGVGLYFSFFYGFNLEYLWPGSPIWDLHSFAFILSFTGVARLLFTRSYLKTWQLLPRWNHFLSVLMALYLLPVLLGALSLAGLADLVPFLIQFIGAMGTLVLLTMLAAGLASYRRGYRPALIFIVANLLFELGALLFIFRETGWMPDNTFSRYAVQLGVIAQVVLFSLGLAYRLNRARNELADEKLAKERLRREKEQEKNELIARQKGQLEQEVAERTADLKQKTSELEKAFRQISDSEHYLRELNQVKDKLFSIISHDLRSPVVTLDSFLNLMSKHADRLSPDELRGLSGKTRQALGNLSFLLENLLHWSRTQMEQIHLQPEAVDLAELVLKNLELFSYQLQEKQLRTCTRFAENSRVLADKNMIDIALRNLLSNALKFSPEGGQIDIETGTHAPGLLQVSITDQGSGFAPEQLQGFQQRRKIMTSRGTRNEKGTGLGLMIAQEFATLNKGKLLAGNTRPQGAVLKLVLPMQNVKYRDDKHFSSLNV